MILGRQSGLVLWLLAAACMAGLLILSCYTASLHYRNLLLVTPFSSGSGTINWEELERINGKSFLLTYEIDSRGSVQALNANYDAVIRKTNYAHSIVLGEQLICGSFFTEADQKEKKRSAVLNQNAAYAMFGSTDVLGETIRISRQEFTVKGVVDDRNKKESNVYIPASCSVENPSSFMIKLERGMTAGQAAGEYKSVVPEYGETLSLSLDMMAKQIYGLLFSGMKFGALGLILCMLHGRRQRLSEHAGRLGALSERHYLRELLQKHRSQVLKTAMVLFEMILMVVVLVTIGLSLLKYGLLLHGNAAAILQAGDSLDFGLICLNLKRAFNLSLLFLSGFLICSTFLVGKKFSNNPVD